MAERLAGYLTADADKPLHEALSDREYHVLRMIAGKSTRQISAELALSVKTVSVPRANLRENADEESCGTRGLRRSQSTL